MFSKYLLIFLILLIICYIYKPKKHLFWNKTQPIYDKLKNEGIIKNTKDLNLVLPKENMNLIIFNKNNINIFINFINKHFNQPIIYDYKYINLSLSNKNIIRGLHLGNKLIGTITGKNSILSINNQLHHAYYVDYLTLNKQYRNKYYAPILISFIINNMKKKNIPIAYYRLDNTKHHFSHFYKTSYYYLNIKDIKINKLDLINKGKLKYIFYKNNKNIIKKLFNFFIKESSKFKIYEYIDLKTFHKIINNDLLNTIIFYYENNIISFITFIDLNYKIDNNVCLVSSIYFFINNNIEYIPFIINVLLNNINKNNKYITLLNNYYNNSIVNYLNMIKSDDTYFYLYNYYLKSIYNFNNTLLF